LSRCRERGGWVADGEAEDDIDDRERTFAKVWFRTGHPWSDAAFLFELDRNIDPREILAERTKMKVQLARYLHAGRPDEDLGWGQVDVRELRRIYAALVEMLKAEAPTLEPGG
jgi:hypothetical protein